MQERLRTLETVAVAPGDIYVKRLREWALDFKIAHAPIRALLAISEPIVPQLPADSRTLLGAAYDLKVAPMGCGEDVHVGIERQLRRLINIHMSQLPSRQLPARQRRSAIDEAIYLLEGEGISSPEPQVDADDSFDTVPLGDDTLTTVPKANAQEDILLLMCKHMRAQSMKLDILVETVRKLLGRQRLLESMIQQHAKTPGPVASHLPRNPLDHHLRSAAEFRNLNVQLLDKSFRQELTSFLTCLGGQNIDEFVKRIFFAVFDDEISLYVNFKGRKTKESLCGYKLYEVILDRCQTVYIGGQQSTEVAVESGVPQGSVLGPTLFIIYVNDCVSELHCGVAMFADDIKLWSVIRTADDEEHLLANLNRLHQWSKAWLLPFNEKKCNILRVGRARSPNHMAYCLNGIPLQEVDSQKDLGVWITTSLKPSLH
nr:unnamed protein product [Spirometra erinaceieuropaei]